MDFDLGIAVAGLFVGFTVGLTGMGGGALMTPLLVLFFRVEPLAAVSSDLVASFVMKPIGGGVHLRKGTVHMGLVRWLVIGSVPAAFLGAIVLDGLGSGDALQDTVKRLLGVALLLAATGLVARTLLQRDRAGDRDAAAPTVRPLPTLLVGATGGLIVGMTSVGSGSLMIVALLMLYPTLSASRLVGTDLVQAVPLVGAAALGHLLFGDFRVDLTTSLLVGAIPGVWLGAHTSARAPDRIIRPALVTVLSASALKLLGVSTAVTLSVVAAGAAVAVLGTRVVRRRNVRGAELAAAAELAAP